MRSLDRSHLGSKMPSAASSLDEVGPRTEVTHFCCAERTGRRRRRGEPTAAAPGNTDAKQLDCSLARRAGGRHRSLLLYFIRNRPERTRREKSSRQGGGWLHGRRARRRRKKCVLNCTYSGAASARRCVLVASLTASARQASLARAPWSSKHALFNESTAGRAGIVESTR